MSTDKTALGHKHDVATIEPSVLRDLIKHENDLINHRLMWFITIQGLLLTALGFLWGKPDTKELVYVFCGIGALCSVSAALVLWRGASAIDRLSSMSAHCDPIIGGQAGIERFLYPWYSLPVLFGAGWVAILWINWHAVA